jgi:hypothetical protein
LRPSSGAAVRHSSRCFLIPAPLGREFYQKHLEFFAAGTQYKERLFMNANRVGKTVAGAFEATCQLTGRYPHWWQRRRFENPTDGWARGANSQTTRDVVQGVLLGRTTGQGMIPAEAIIHTVAGRGITGSIEAVWVSTSPERTPSWGSRPTNRAGGPSRAKPRILSGVTKSRRWTIYTEILYRLLTTKGLAWTTFTPLLGMSEVVLSFLEPIPGLENRGLLALEA